MFGPITCKYIISSWSILRSLSLASKPNARTTIRDLYNSRRWCLKARSKGDTRINKNWKFLVVTLTTASIKSLKEYNTYEDLPLNSTRSVFSLSPLRHGQSNLCFTLAYVCTSTGSTCASTPLQLLRSDPCVADTQGFYFCRMPEHGALIQLNLAQSRQKVTYRNQQHNIWLIFIIKKERQIKALLLILRLGTLTLCLFVVVFITHTQYLTKMSTPLTFLYIFYYIFSWELWRNDTLLHCEVVGVQLV